MKGSTYANDLLKLVFNAVAIADLAQDDGSGPLTALVVALHTADPGVGGSQSTYQAAYAWYARVSVARTTGGWTVTANEASNAALTEFPQCTGGGAEVELYASIGTAATGAGKVLYVVPLNSPVVVVSGTTPRFAAGTLRVREV